MHKVTKVTKPHITGAHHSTRVSDYVCLDNKNLCLGFSPGFAEGPGFPKTERFSRMREFPY